MTTVAKRVRTVQRRLLEAAYGAQFRMLLETTNLSNVVLLDALTVCEDEPDPPARVLQLWQDWGGGGSGGNYWSFPDYVRYRHSPPMMNP